MNKKKDLMIIIMSVTKSIINDQYIHIVFKSGGEAVLHELQLEGKTIEEVYSELLTHKETGAFYTYDNFHCDTGQIAGMILDRRSYITFDLPVNE